MIDCVYVIVVRLRKLRSKKNFFNLFDMDYCCFYLVWKLKGVGSDFLNEFFY